MKEKKDAYKIIGERRSIYIAYGLPKVLYSAGTRMYVTIQKPDSSTTLVCTTMDPSYVQVNITAVK